MTNLKEKANVLNIFIKGLLNNYILFKDLTLIIVALISGINDGICITCSKQEYQQCVIMADPLLKDPHLIYPDNPQDIDRVCRWVKLIIFFKFVLNTWNVIINLTCQKKCKIYDLHKIYSCNSRDKYWYLEMC